MPARNVHTILIACLISAVCFATANRVRRTVLLGDAMSLIDRFYVDPIESSDLIEAAMAGLTSRLDRHSEFIPADLYSQFNDVIQQEFAGVGILVEQPQAGKPVRVITPLVGSPALIAGVLPGDEIIGVAGVDVSELPIREVSDRLRGPVGTTVSVRIRRVEEEMVKLHEISLRRETITLESVVGDHRDADDQWIFRLRKHPEIAYIRVTSFGEKTELELRRVLSELDNDFESLILDVRGNSGGLLITAVEVCDDFLDQGRIVTIKKRGGVIEKEFDAEPGTFVRKDTSIVVLIDGDSASASEIVAACLQDHGRATIIGSRSFGKGTVQNVLPLESGRSALKLTTARYYRPNGRNIHRREDSTESDEWGVSPDEGMSVTMTDEARQALVEHWRQVSFPASTSTTAANNTDATAAASSKDASGQLFDPQLSKAIDFLTSDESFTP